MHAWSVAQCVASSTQLRHELTEIDVIDIQQPQTLRASPLAVFVRAVDLMALAALHGSEFGCKKDLVALARALEPLADEAFVGTVKASHIDQPQPATGSMEEWAVMTYSELSQNLSPSSCARSNIAKTSSSLGIAP